MSIGYLCMLGLRGAMGSCPGGWRWPQKSGKARMLNPGIDLVLAAAARYSLGSWCRIQAPCLFNKLSIMVQWWNSSVPSSSISCSFPLRMEGASPLWEENNNRIRHLESGNKVEVRPDGSDEIVWYYCWSTELEGKVLCEIIITIISQTERWTQAHHTKTKNNLLAHMLNNPGLTLRRTFIQG